MIEGREDTVRDIEERLVVLEAEVQWLRRLITPTPQAAPMMPMTPAGCVCPAGTELGCGAVLCPRRGTWRG